MTKEYLNIIFGGEHNYIKIPEYLNMKIPEYLNIIFGSEHNYIKIPEYLNIIHNYIVNIEWILDGKQLHLDTRLSS